MPELDAVTQLQGVIDEIAAKVSGLNGMKEKQEELEEKIRKYEEMQAKGFPIPTGHVEGDDNCYGFSLAHQGKSLINKFENPGGYHMDPAKKNEIAKVLLMFVRGGLMQDPFVTREYKEKYRQKTGEVIGDSGNVFPVPDILETEILAYAREKSVLLQDATVIDMTSIKQSWPIETGQSAVGWGNTTSQSNPDIDEIELDAEELSAYSAVRNHQLADARSDIVSWLLINLATACGLEIDNQGFNGRKAGGSDPFDGICSVNESSVQSVTMGAGERFADVNDDYFSQMIAKLDGLKKQGAKYYMNGAVMHYVRQIKDGVGNPIFMPGNIATGQPSTIYGYGNTEAVKMNSTDSGSKVVAIFGNPKQLFIGRRLDSTALIVDPYGLFTTNRTRFKIYQRWAVKVALPAGFVKLITGA